MYSIKPLLIFNLTILLCISVRAQSDNKKQFKDKKVFNIVDYGAVADGKTINTEAIYVEGEVNGFMTYDRKVDKLDISKVKKVNQEVIGVIQE